MINHCRQPRCERTLAPRYIYTRIGSGPSTDAAAAAAVTRDKWVMFLLRSVCSCVCQRICRDIKDGFPRIFMRGCVWNEA